MKTLGILTLLAVFLLAACGGPATTSQSWTQSASASCSGFMCRATVNQEMPQARADNTLLAASLLAVASLVIVVLALAGAL